MRKQISPQTAATMAVGRVRRSALVRTGLILALALAAVPTLGTDRASAIQLSREIAQMYAAVEMAPPTAAQMTVCYGFVCRLRLVLAFSPAERAHLTSIMTKGRDSAAGERRAIQQAFVWFDHRVAREAGTTRRVARADFRSGDASHNFDCFDTTRNAVSLLLIFQEWRVLRHHTVSDPRYRGNVLFGQTPHNTAVLTERTGGQSWAVDMWTTRFGQVPDVMPLERWLAEN
jgi:hypothetical protein